VKFRYEENSITRYGYYFAIDNFRLRASLYPLGWLTVDGAEISNGVVLPNADGIPSIVDVQMDATGLAVGTYTADILVTSTDAGNPSTTVPVTFNVIAGNTVSGNIAYANVALTPLETCTVELYNDAAEMLFSTSTDAAGYYEFTGMLDGTYTLITTCNLVRGGTNILDAINTRQYLGGGFPMIELQELAGDVNETGAVDILDAIFMQQSLSGPQPAGWTAPDYVFIEQTAVVAGGNVTVTYQGLCSGDPNGSHTPAK